MRIEFDDKLDFSDVLIRPKRSTLSSRKQVDLTREYTFKHSKQNWKGIPIMAANMDGVGTIDMALALQEHLMFTCLVKSYNAKVIHEHMHKLDPNHMAVSTGTSSADFENLKQIISDNPNIKFICIDVANGYSEHFGDYVEKVRKSYPKHIIIAGNVVTADMTQELILRGADIVKVGIGPGSVCTTRIQTGVGYPQLSAIIECADAAHGLGAHIISDGGCTSPGDVAKAFGAGADFVMLGGMLAGHDQGGGNIITEHHNSLQRTKDSFEPIYIEKKYVQFYGMSSTTAMIKHHGEIADYRSSEGRTVKIPYRGDVEASVLDILGGLRSTCTYVGASHLKHLSKCTTFIKVHRQFNDVFVNTKH
ncbi:GMP reductase [Liberiplasma polymorphum]|uniref:GMP reductase n=1 Tax=Liberiplasma polymorphum TaxID=3374570 RepID=UPI0037768D17